MSQSFEYPFNETESVRTTMEDIFENTKTLKSSFSGGSQPSNAEVGMLWADTSNHLYKIRGDTNWHEIMELDTGSLFIGDYSVEAIHISDSARKPSLVDGETIEPDRIENMTACNLRSNSSSLPSMSTMIQEWTSYSPSPEYVVTQAKFYWPGSTTSTSFYMHIYGANAQARFTVGSSSYSSSVSVSGSGWSSGSGASLSFSGGLGSGWQLIKIYFRYHSLGGNGLLSGYSFGATT